jgi:AcrR family transcriptional regulator
MTQEPVVGGARRWRGREPQDRRDERRQKLLDAGFSLMGGQGAAATSVRGVCREARLTERYFYESFANRDELLVAVLESVAGRSREVLIGALETAPPAPGALVRHVVGAFTDFVVADPRRGRVLFVESLAAPALAAAGAALVGDFTAPIAAAMRGGRLGPRDGDDLDIDLNALAVFGSLAYLYQGWTEQHASLSRERFIEHASLVIERLAGVRSAPAP